jgi:uncharacterized membrane protein
MKRTAAARRGAAATRTPADARAGVTRSASPNPARIPGLDALRGLAIVAMAAYHFCFDLRWFGYAQWDFEHDPRWIAARSLILGSFLLLAGVSLVLASRRADASRAFVRQVARIAAAALVVTIASYFAFPRSFIWFGVLHAIAVSLLLARPLVAHPRAALALGAAVVAAGVAWSSPAFDAPPLRWIGFMTHKPVTEDYVPLFPWAGVLLLGIPLGHALLQRGPGVLAPFGRLPAGLAWLGRHSLLVYLVHQPVLVGLLWLVSR